MPQQQDFLFDSIPCDKLSLLTRKELEGLQLDTQDLVEQMRRHIKKLEQQLVKHEQKRFLLGEQLVNIKNKLFGRSSEKSPRKPKQKRDKKKGKQVKLPSERYPNSDILEKDVEFNELPSCPCCSGKMQDSGLIERSEYLHVIPKRFVVVVQKRHKYRCSSCQEALVTAPAIPRITPGGAYSDEMIIDVAMSKYLDLIPLERYAAMAARGGVPDIPPNSLHALARQLAEFIRPARDEIVGELRREKVLHGDDTPHRMLEGDKKKSWYLWGFSSNTAGVFEARDTRAGEVAEEFLQKTRCQYFMSDAYAGFKKAIKRVNEKRKKLELPLIVELNCNSHARRKFTDAALSFEEAKLFIRLYARIYRLKEVAGKKMTPEKSRRWQHAGCGFCCASAKRCCTWE